MSLDDDRNRQLLRQWRVLLLLSSLDHGASWARLSEATGVTVRTLRRDVAGLRAIGVPIETDRYHDGVRVLLALRDRDRQAVRSGLFALTRPAA